MHHWSCHRSSKLQWRWIMTENAMEAQAFRPQTPDPKPENPATPPPSLSLRPSPFQVASWQSTVRPAENRKQPAGADTAASVASIGFKLATGDVKRGDRVAGGDLAGDVGVSTCNRRRRCRRRGRCHWHLTHTHFPACCSAAVALQLQLQLRGRRKASAMSSCRQCDIICVYSVADKQKIIMRGVWIHRKKCDEEMLQTWGWDNYEAIIFNELLQKGL